MPERYTATQVIDAIREAKGIKSVAARRLGCHWLTVHRYCKRYPTIQAAYEETRQELVDLAEGKLRLKVERGLWPAIKWVLATLGKDRGWVERKELTGAEGGPVEHKDVTNISDTEAGRRLLALLERGGAQALVASASEKQRLPEDVSE